MRYGYAALVLSSLLLQKDLSGGPALRSQTAGEAGGKDGPAGSCQEGNRLLPFHMLRSQLGFCWIPESPWGIPLAGAIVLLLWLVVEMWSSSCLATLRVRLQQPITTESCVTQPISPSLPEAESEEESETDFQVTETKHSSCICGKQLTSDFESYEPPCEGHRHPHDPYQNLGREGRDESLYQEYNPCPPPLLRSNVILRKCSCSSSSSSVSSFSLPLLKCLNLRCSVARDASWTTLDSSGASETSSSDSPSSESESLYLKKRKREPSLVPLLPEKRPEIKGAPQTSFAQISILQSSAFEKKDHVVLVEKSLEILMGPMPASVATTSPPRLMIADKEETGDKPLSLPLLGQTAFQYLDIRVKDQKEELHNTVEKSTPKTSSQKEEEPAKPKVAADSASMLPDLEKTPFVLKAMDKKSREFLEFHVKKKMVQRRCGVPTVVTKSVNQFQSLKNPFRGDLKRPLQNVLLIPSNAEAPAYPYFPPRNAMAVYMKSLQVSPRSKGYYIFHKVDPEEIRKVGFHSPGNKLGLKTRDSQRTQGNYVLSVEPEKLRKLLFHLTVKMVEIQKGAFPEMVENSFRIFNILSVKPLPKLIHFGNKIPRPKHLSLSFVAREALCIIDLNISHKYVVYTWGIPTLRSKSTEKASSGISRPTEEHPADTEKKVLQKPRPPIIVLKSPKRRAPSPETEVKQILLTPEPQTPQGSLFPCVAPAEESQSVHFLDHFKQTTLAPSVPSENAEEHPPRSLVVSLMDATIQKRVETYGQSEEIHVKKVVLALPFNKRQEPADRDSTSTKQGALMEKTADGKFRTLKAVNPQEELQDQQCSTNFPAPLKKGAKADGKEAGSQKDGNQQADLEGTLHYTTLSPSTETGTRTGSQKDGNRQADLEGTLSYTTLPPSTETRTRTGSQKDGNRQADLEGTLSYTTLPPSTETGTRTGSQKDGNRQADLEGTLRYTTLPPSTETGSQKDGNQQADLEGTLHYTAFPLSPKSGAEADGEITVAKQARSSQRFPDRVFSSSLDPKDVAAGERKAGAKAARGSQKEMEGRCSGGPLQTRAEGLKKARAPRREGLSLSLGITAVGSKRGPRADGAGQREASITRASLFFELDVTKEKLNLHLKKQLEAALRPRQRAGLRLSVEAGREPGRRRPRRPFCYVCLPPDGRGAALRTVCWALPKRILDMNGGRVPQVARFESKPGEAGRRGPGGRRRAGGRPDRPGAAGDRGH